MANYARVNSDNIVIFVTPIRNERITDENGVEHEGWALPHLYTSIPDSKDDRWIQTSYNNNFRVHYAGINYSYSDELDAFISPQPFSSWNLNAETLDWEPPLGDPPNLTEEQVASGFIYRWNDELYQQDNTSGWILENRSES